MRLAGVALVMTASLGAADASGWITDAGGVVTRDRAGRIIAVDLRGSWVTDADLAGLAQLPDLARLDLSLTRISDHGLQQLKDARAITDLNLHYDELITDAGLSALKNWKRLRRLNARGTRITDTSLRHLAGVSSLESLDVGYAQITDAGLGALTSLPNLKELTIGGNKLTDTGLQPLRQLPGLRYLDLSGAQRTDSGLWSVSLAEPGLDAIATLKEVRRLRLNGTMVSARGLEKLKDLSKLQRLELQGCSRIGDDAITALGSFPALRAVDLTGTRITSRGFAALGRARPDCRVIAGEAGSGKMAAEEPED